MRIIDADALMRDIEHYHLSDGKFQHWVEVQPTIEERKTGKWVPDPRNAYEMRFVCTNCMTSAKVPTIGFTAHKPVWNYCPCWRILSERREIFAETEAAQEGEIEG